MPSAPISPALEALALICLQPLPSTTVSSSPSLCSLGSMQLRHRPVPEQGRNLLRGWVLGHPTLVASQAGRQTQGPCLGPGATLPTTQEGSFSCPCLTAYSALRFSQTRWHLLPLPVPGRGPRAGQGVSQEPGSVYFSTFLVLQIPRNNSFLIRQRKTCSRLTHQGLAPAHWLTEQTQAFPNERSVPQAVRREHMCLSSRKGHRDAEGRSHG